MLENGNLLFCYAPLININGGQFLGVIDEPIEFMLMELHQSPCRSLTNMQQIENTIHIVKKLVMSLFHSLVSPKNGMLRGSRYSKKVKYHIDRIYEHFYRYFYYLACKNHPHQSVHDFQRFESGYSQHLSIDNKNLSNRIVKHSNGNFITK